MTIYIPYFYIIQEVSTGMYYAGAKWGKDSNPNLLWKVNGYFTSSSKIKQLIETNGNDSFIIRKIKIFETGNEAYYYEKRFLEKIDAANNLKFYNCHNNTIPSIGSPEYKIMMLHNYGVDHNMKIKSCQESRICKIRQKYGSVSKMLKESGAVEKAKETNLELYGVEYTLHTEYAKKKSREALIEKYGVDNPLKCKEIKQKALNTYKKNYSKKQEPIIREIMNCDIDFSKEGWVTKVSLIIGITPQKVSNWMKRNMPQFYEEKCKKRKPPSRK